MPPIHEQRFESVFHIFTGLYIIIVGIAVIQNEFSITPNNNTTHFDFDPKVHKKRKTLKTVSVPILITIGTLILLRGLYLLLNIIKSWVLNHFI